MKNIIAIVRCILVATLGCLLASNAQAEVHIARFDPPLSLGAFSDPAPGLDWNTTAFDFDLDGLADFRLTYGGGTMAAFFNTPTCYAVQMPPPNAIIFPIDDPIGPVGSVPLGSMIGSNIVSSIGTNFYAWSLGLTNILDFPELLGDHEEVLMYVPQISHGPVLLEPATFSNGVLAANKLGPKPFVTGDVVGQEGVIALQFYIGSERHYGYIHFNFKAGSKGAIYGWAYETEPDVPITAMPLLPGEKLNKHKILFEPK
jgi:hypothetical protein